MKEHVKYWYDQSRKVRDGGECKKQILLIWERDKGTCHLCGGYVPHPIREWEMLTEDNVPTKDHIKPRSAGGKSRIWNYALAHRKCNNDRKSMHVDDYKSILRDGETDAYSRNLCAERQSFFRRMIAKSYRRPSRMTSCSEDKEDD